jgi:hypothetical protein
MAYSNWGENISNTFMSMYATNAQRKLEQERLAMERQKLESQLETDKLSREWTGEQIKQARDEAAYYAAHPLYLDMTDDNFNNPTPMDPRYADKYVPYAWTETSVPTFDNGVYGIGKEWTQNRNAESLLALHGTIASGKGQAWENERNRQNDTANARIQANASSVQSSLMQQKMAWDNMTTLGTNIQSDLDTIKHYMFVDGNGQLKAYGAKVAAAKEYIGRIMRAHPGMSEQQVKDQISNALLQGAIGGGPKSKDAKLLYEYDPKINNYVKVGG